MKQREKSTTAQERVLLEARAKGAITHEQACAAGHWQQAGYHLRWLCRVGLLEKTAYNTWKPVELPPPSPPPRPRSFYLDLFELVEHYKAVIERGKEQGKDMRDTAAITRAIEGVLDEVENGYLCVFDDRY